MSLHLALLTDRGVRSVCVAVGLVFLVIALYVWLQGELQRSGTELLLLFPLLPGTALRFGAVALNARALRALLVFWFVIAPALFYLVSWVGCEARMLSPSYCQ
jgi:hypothetical protein